MKVIVILFVSIFAVVSPQAWRSSRWSRILSGRPVGPALEKADCRKLCSCSFVYDPVCGRDRRSREMKTFPNQCVLGCINCEMKKDFIVQKKGKCSQKGGILEHIPRQNFCTADCSCAQSKFDPLCAKNAENSEFQSFPNECVMKCTNCALTGKNYVVQFPGYCQFPLPG